MNRGRVLLVSAVVTNAMMVGATLDQAIKQLPARHHIGPAAFSQYSRAGDLGNGIVWYATLGGIGSVLALAASATVLCTRAPQQRRWALLAAVGTVGHMGVTAWAAPLNFSQRAAADNPAALAAIFDRFEELNVLRAGLQVTVLVALAAGLLTVQSARGTGGTDPQRTRRPRRDWR